MSRLLFTKVPITVSDDTLPVLNDANVTALAQYEYEALGHWVFNKGGAANLIDVTRYSPMAPMGGASLPPVHGGNYMLYAAALGEALETEFTNADVPNGTMALVFKSTWPGAVYPQNDSPDYPLICGNMGTGVGGSLYILVNNTIIKHTVLNKTAAELTTAPTIGNWYFLAGSWKSGTGGGVNCYLGIAAGSEYVYQASNGSRTNDSQPICLGNPLQTGAAYDSGEYTLGEFMLFDTFMLEPDLEALYIRSKARMLAQGITIQ